jgi:hypothetical protein
MPPAAQVASPLARTVSLTSEESPSLPEAPVAPGAPVAPRGPAGKFTSVHVPATHATIFFSSRTYASVDSDALL